jgi:hypothetical protein
MRQPKSRRRRALLRSLNNHNRPILSVISSSKYDDELAMYHMNRQFLIAVYTDSNNGG